MMRWPRLHFGRSLHVREWGLLTAALFTIAAVLLVYHWLMPMYDQWTMLRAQVYAQQQELTTLERNLAMREAVEARFVELGRSVIQSESDQIILSRFLREIEAAARQPSLTLINMSPRPIDDNGTSKRYPVRLSVSGTPQDVVEFTAQVLNNSTVVGLESYSLRGVQGGHTIECTLSLWMVRLVEAAPSPDVVGDIALSQAKR